MNTMVKKDSFEVDFFELSFLVEACIPPTPIARSMLWHKVINKFFHNMSWKERDDLLSWIKENGSFKDSLESGDVDCLLFNDRFDKDNQYKVVVSYDGGHDEYECFMHKDMYMINSTTSIINEYIVSKARMEIDVDSSSYVNRDV